MMSEGYSKCRSQRAISVWNCQNLLDVSVFVAFVFRILAMEQAELISPINEGRGAVVAPRPPDR